MGYSCSDRFDINPAIASLEDKRQHVIFIEHTLIPVSEASITALSAIDADHPFFGFNGYILRCNTDDFVDAIWSSLIQSEPPSVKWADHDWRTVLNQWFHNANSQKGFCVGAYIGGMLFKGSGSYRTSNNFLSRTLTAGPSPDIEVAAYQTLGDNHRDMGEFEKAFFYLRKALTSSQEHNFRWRQARILSSLGIVTEDQKDHQRAISYYKRAMKLTRRTGDKELRGKCNGNIGIAYKNIGDTKSLKKAIRYQKNALRIARDIGDKRSEGRALGNMGIAYSDLGDKVNAIDYYFQAKAVAEDLRDSRHIGIWLANAGMDYVGLDNSQAFRLLNGAVAIFDKLGLPHYIAECEQFLSQINGPDQPNGGQSAA